MEKYKQWASEVHPSEAVHGMGPVDDSDEDEPDLLCIETPGDSEAISIYEQASDAAEAVEVFPFDFANGVAGRGWAGWAASFLW